MAGFSGAEAQFLMRWGFHGLKAVASTVVLLSQDRGCRRGGLGRLGGSGVHAMAPEGAPKADQKNKRGQGSVVPPGLGWIGAPLPSVETLG
jgi:hypothetical protein